VPRQFDPAALEAGLRSPRESCWDQALIDHLCGERAGNPADRECDALLEGLVEVREELGCATRGRRLLH
jgi:hypothetical protein